eukprot:scpid48523/ scgid33207/ Lysosomal-trafficking regulator; Beige homolog
MARLLVSMAAAVDEVFIGQMLLGSLSRIVSCSPANGAIVTDLKLAEHCLKCFTPMFTNTQKSGLEETVVSFLVTVCQWQTTSETLYMLFRLIITAGCMQTRLMLLAALSKLVDVPYFPTHAIAFQLGAQPTPEILNQIEMLCMDMEDCATQWPKNGLSLVMRCCLHVTGLAEKATAISTWFLLCASRGEHEIQLAADSHGSILVWYRWSEKQSKQDPLVFERLLKFGEWYHIGCVLDLTSPQARVHLYLDGVAVGSKQVPGWSAAAMSSASGGQSAHSKDTGDSLMCEIGSESNLLQGAPGAIPSEASVKVVGDIEESASLIVEGQEAITGSSASPVYSTLLVSSTLVFESPVSATGIFALYTSSFTSIGLDGVMLYRGGSGYHPSWISSLHELFSSSFWAHLSGTNKHIKPGESWSFTDSQTLMGDLCMGYTATSPSHWYCFHCKPSPHSSNGTVPAQITGGLPQSAKHTHTKDAILALGGMRAVLYLAALCASWDAERRCDGNRLLPHAIHLIFSLSKGHSGNWLDLSQCCGHQLLRQVMLTGRYTSDTNTLQTLLNNICDKQLVYFSEEGTLAVLAGSDAIIVRPRFIESVLLEWRVWWKAGLEVWYASLKSLLAIISESHPHAAFNIRQCEEAGVLRLLINTSRDFPSETCRPVPDPIIRIIDSMITVFLGSPPDMTVLNMLCDFLLNERSSSVIHNIPVHLLNPLRGNVGANTSVATSSSVASQAKQPSRGRPLLTSTPGEHIKTRLSRTPKRSVSSPAHHPIKNISTALFEVASDDVAKEGRFNSDGIRALNSSGGGGGG